MGSKSIRTDLAMEMREILSDGGSEEIPGVEVDITTDEAREITVTWVRITNDQGAKAMGKPIGSYVTVECQAMRENDILTHEELMKTLAQNLGKLYPLPPEAGILVVGLGNWQVTPDALGPKVCAKLLVTRHMAGATPPELQGHIRAVSALSPGVMGLTGIETSEIIKGVAEKVKPDLIIAVDALAARHSARINTTVQMTDTGVSPGAGMGNRRMALNAQTLGVPVLAVGVPTVVDAATLVNDAMDKMLDAMIKASPKGQPFYEMLMELQEEEKYGLIRETLEINAGNLFVTPKDVDAVINRLANIVANGLNMALHPGIDAGDVNRYLN